MQNDKCKESGSENAEESARVDSQNGLVQRVVELLGVGCVPSPKDMPWESPDPPWESWSVSPHQT